MPFSPRFHTPTAAFPSDIFHVLNELNQSAASAENAARSGNKRAFSPNFDILETDSAFFLEGELPGLADKSKLNIEFTDENTLLVRGKIEKSAQKTSSNNSKAPEKSTQAAEGPNTETQVASRTDNNKAVSKPNENFRYWVSERTVGEFQRSFSFPGAVDIEAVKANLEDGLLKIVVPKKELAKGKKIEIS